MDGQQKVPEAIASERKFQELSDHCVLFMSVQELREFAFPSMPLRV